MDNFFYLRGGRIHSLYAGEEYPVFALCHSRFARSSHYSDAFGMDESENVK
ncbi:MAG TPA: hypothetical protein PK842_09435 [Smithella sp.]|jgi:hypothetical protein|nr:hypothetical protein [Smithella sp.]HOX98401.1 hypothetical protein [Smithella sp.]HPH54862.1 hypothetical protein [Smithella sp.]HPK22994.1 hypothetical protein [Smithella sp.]HPL48622.1 hypothetical protein [Smithella sp.]